MLASGTRTLPLCMRQEFSWQLWITTSTAIDQQWQIQRAIKCKFYIWNTVFYICRNTSLFTFLLCSNYFVLVCVQFVSMCSEYVTFNSWHLCNYSFRRQYNKNARRYSLYVLKCGKTYDYIPDLQARIVKRRVTSEAGMPRRRTLRLDDPRRLGVVPPIPPPAMSELMQSQVSRGLGMCTHLYAFHSQH